MTQTQRNHMAWAFFGAGKLLGATAIGCAYLKGNTYLIGCTSLMGAFFLLGVSIYLCLVNLRLQAKEEWKP